MDLECNVKIYNLIREFCFRADGVYSIILCVYSFVASAFVMTGSSWNSEMARATDVVNWKVEKTPHKFPLVFVIQQTFSLLLLFR